MFTEIVIETNNMIIGNSSLNEKMKFA